MIARNESMFPGAALQYCLIRPRYFGTHGLKPHWGENIELRPGGPALPPSTRTSSFERAHLCSNTFTSTRLNLSLASPCPTGRFPDLDGDPSQLNAVQSREKSRTRGTVENAKSAARQKRRLNPSRQSIRCARRRSECRFSSAQKFRSCGR